MNATYRNLVLATMLPTLLAVWAAGVNGAAQSQSAPVAIQKVLAVEDADSPLGRYRIVFTTTERLPSAADLLSGAGFILDKEPVRFSPMAPATTRHHGYVNQLPDGLTELMILDPRPAGIAGQARPSGVKFNAAAMLAASRPAPGQFEADHIQRSEGDLDLWQEWSDADVVFVGVLMREDQDPEHDGQWRLFFQPEQVMRGGEQLALPDLVILHIDGRSEVNELGGRYMVFADAEQAVLKAEPDAHAHVRLWWPENDDVQEFIAKRTAMPENAEPGEIGTLLLEWLSSPADEVRYTAAVQLANLAAQLPDDVAHKVGLEAQIKMKTEPVTRVKQAIQALVETPALQPRQ